MRGGDENNRLSCSTASTFQTSHTGTHLILTTVLRWALLLSFYREGNGGLEKINTCLVLQLAGVKPGVVLILLQGSLFLTCKLVQLSWSQDNWGPSSL